jgi:hypothetical protein
MQYSPVRPTQTLAASIDIRPLITSLMRSHRWSQIQAQQACQKYLKFLHLLQLYPNHQLIPTQEIDQVWHCHILHTRQYRQDCQTLFGEYLDHEPELDWQAAGHQTALTALQQTKAIFEQHFGESYCDSWSDGPVACVPVRSQTDVSLQEPAACGPLR